VSCFSSRLHTCAVSSGGLQLAMCLAVRLGRPQRSRLAFFYLCVFLQMLLSEPVFITVCFLLQGCEHNCINQRRSSTLEPNSDIRNLTKRLSKTMRGLQMKFQSSNVFFIGGAWNLIGLEFDLCFLCRQLKNRRLDRRAASSFLISLL
jgi:hypothetical protein